MIHPIANFIKNKVKVKKMKNDEILMKRATSSVNLKRRSSINDKYAVNNFDGFITDILNNIKFKSALDICCGTGNQIMHYIEIPHIQEVVGIDISSESLNTARERIKGNKNENKVQFICTPMEEMFSDQGINQKNFDLISCHYGLYYSKCVADTLKECYEHLSPKGNILIVGPYGENNHELFDILDKFTNIPDVVKYSSGNFMENEVLPILTGLRLKIQLHKFKNEIRYPDLAAVMNYWRASTFYDERAEEKVEEQLKTIFLANQVFSVSKHVMACVAEKSI